jgi:ABC-type sugar transport system ATPase subunit
VNGSSPNTASVAQTSVPSSMPDGETTLRLVNIHKRYGGIHALDGADLVVPLDFGSVVGLLGENGSGKSTLLGVLSGQVRPDSGSILLRGQPISMSSPLAAIRQGIAMVAQETAVFPDLSVAENVVRSQPMPRSPLGIRWTEVRRRARATLDLLQLDYDLDTPVRRLRPDQQQMVEIARVLAADARILILDEPTSSLTDDQAQALFAVIRRLRGNGIATIFVSHRLEEVMQLVDTLTILRDGRTVCSEAIANFDSERVITEMVGQAALSIRRAAAAESDKSEVVVANSETTPVLRVRGLEIPNQLFGIDLDVHAGEIVGLAGLVGAGRSYILESVFGATAYRHGTVELDGVHLAAKSPRAAIAAGIGYLPPDRKTQALVLCRSVRENLAMVSTIGKSRIAKPNLQTEDAVFATAKTTMNLRAAAPDVSVMTLSGGNQQKVALGKWTVGHPKCLLLDEPTRGVDAGAKEEIHRALRQLASSGLAILVSSSEYDELLEVCDRILVVYRGRVVASLPRAGADQATIAHYAGGYS